MTCWVVTRSGKGKNKDLAFVKVQGTTTADEFMKKQGETDFASADFEKPRFTWIIHYLEPATDRDEIRKTGHVTSNAFLNRLFSYSSSSIQFSPSSTPQNLAVKMYGIVKQSSARKFSKAGQVQLQLLLSRSFRSPDTSLSPDPSTASGKYTDKDAKLHSTADAKVN